MFRTFPLCRLLLPTLLVVACVQAPVQEMSDARQAIQAARAVAVEPAQRMQLDAATQLLREAESALEARRYVEARRLAIRAHEDASAVRERAAQPN